MKNTMKLAAKVGLICCLLGTLLCIVGLLGGANPGVVLNSDTLDIEYDDGSFEVESDFMAELYSEKMKVEHPLEEFQNISIDTTMCDLVLGAGAEYSITIQDAKYHFDDEAIQYEVKDGTLYLTESTGNDPYGLHEEMRKVWVKVPKDVQLDNVTIRQDRGEFAVQALDIRDLDISSQSGELDLRVLTLDTLKAESESGDIYVASVDVSSATEITNASGNTEISGDFLGETRLNNGSGEMLMDLYSKDLERYYRIFESGFAGDIRHGSGSGYYNGEGYVSSTFPEMVNDPNAPNKIYVNNGTGVFNFDW